MRLSIIDNGKKIAYKKNNRLTNKEKGLYDVFSLTSISPQIGAIQMNIHVATVETMCPLVESLFDNDLVFIGATSDHSVSGCQISAFNPTGWSHLWDTYLVVMVHVSF